MQPVDTTTPMHTPIATLIGHMRVRSRQRRLDYRPQPLPRYTRHIPNALVSLFRYIITLLLCPPPFPRLWITYGMHLLINHITSRHITPRHITSRHVTSRHITPHHIPSHNTTSHPITSRHITPRHIPSHHVTSHNTTSRHIPSHHVT